MPNGSGVRPQRSEMTGSFGFSDAIYFGSILGALSLILVAVAFDTRYHLDVFLVLLVAYWVYLHLLCSLTGHLGRPRR